MLPRPGIPPPRDPTRWDVLYPNAYLSLVLVSAMDIMVTWRVLHLGGEEANPLAAQIIDQFNVLGMIGFKFLLVIVFLLACEFVGRRRPRTGRTMAYTAVGLSVAPVGVGLFLLATSI
jgi:hypothetical protein